MAQGIQSNVLALGVMAALWFGPATAQDAQDAKGSPAARSLIERQLDAFSRGDAEGAYAEAAPTIKMLFGDSATFMTMVREHYAPVYRHRSVEFGRAKTEGDTIEQAATFVDENGEVWTAVYGLTRQPDGQWLISSCRLIKAESV